MLAASALKPGEPVEEQGRQTSQHRSIAAAQHGTPRLLSCVQRPVVQDEHSPSRPLPTTGLNVCPNLCAREQPVCLRGTEHTGLGDDQLGSLGNSTGLRTVNSS